MSRPNPSPPRDFSRTLIFGNGGSGKTWLSKRLGGVLGRTPIHLDDLRWQPGNYGLARDNQLVVNGVVAASATEFWLMEGVYGWLAKAALPRATSLIWLDLPESECIANVTARGTQGNGTPEAFRELIAWISDYRIRDNSTCFAAHQRLFDGFGGYKMALHTRAEIDAFLATAVEH